MGERFEKGKNKGPRERSKMIHSEIQNDLGNEKDSQVEASKITINFERFKVEANGKNDTSSVLTSYTELVSIDELSNT